jgi:hypothetical protein
MNYQLPGYLIKLITSLPKHYSKALLLRHGERGVISPGNDGNEVDLTNFGYKQSLALGKSLNTVLSWAKHSPLLRAKRTVELIIQGTENTIPSAPSVMLGEPGPFVIDRTHCAKLFSSMSTECLVRQLAAGASFSGMKTAKEGARSFINYAEKLLINDGLGVLISHDAIIIPMISAWTGESFANQWLNPLDGVLICKEKHLCIYWKGRRYTL